MGAGWGGHRPGSGRKPKSAEQKAVTGDTGHRKKTPPSARVLAHPSSPVEPSKPKLPEVDEADVPDDLPMDARHVWLKLAPHALLNKTLTPATELAFGVLCQNVVLLKAMFEAPLARGTADHRGLIQRVDAELLRFNLSPCGKPMADAADAAPAATANPLAKYMA